MAGCLGWTRSAARVPDVCGAYALLVLLERAIELPPRFGGRRLAKGSYCYVGSAHGPGGMRARCARHLRSSATRHWHVDWLTAGAADLLVMACPGQRECDLLNRLLRINEVPVPVPGFGSSDCHHCPNHLVAVGRASLRALCGCLEVG